MNEDDARRPRPLDWIISMRWHGLNPKTAVLRAIELLHLNSVHARGGPTDDHHLLGEDIEPKAGLRVQLGRTVIVHLGGTAWGLQDVSDLDVFRSDGDAHD